MKSERFEKLLQKLADIVSEFDDVHKDAEMNVVPGPNQLDIQRQQFLRVVDKELSNIDNSVERIGEGIEQLKTFERVL